MEQNQLLEQMIAQQAADNPQLQTMLAMMQQSKANKTATGEGSDTEQELAACRARLSKAIAKIKQMSEGMEALQQDLAAMVHFGEELAHAVGACTFCWGEDIACRACRGRGKPGSFEPDPALFQRFVLPAYRRNKTNLQ